MNQRRAAKVQRRRARRGQKAAMRAFRGAPPARVRPFLGIVVLAAIGALLLALWPVVVAMAAWQVWA